MGNTWIGLDRLTQRKFFAKAAGSGDDAESLIHEFRVTGSVRAPGIARALDLVAKISGEMAIDAPGPFLVLERVSGFPWPQGPLQPSRVANLLDTLLDTLQRLHLQGWLHLDLKPENVLVDGEKLTLVDLGHARRPGDMASLTGVWGTRGFVPPEILRFIDSCPLPGDELGWSSDLYQVGLLALIALTGCAVPEDPHRSDRWWERPVADILTSEAGAWIGLLDGLLAPLCSHRFANAAHTRHALGRLHPTHATAPAVQIPVPQRCHRHLLHAIQAGLRESVPTMIHLHGPPGSGRDRMLEKSAQQLRLNAGVALAWMRTNPLQLMGDAAGSPLPLVLFLENAPQLTDWAELDGLLSGLTERPLVLIVSGERPSKDCLRNWRRVDLIVPSLPPRVCVRLVRSLGRELGPASLCGGHPALLRGEEDGSIDAVVDWLKRYATDPLGLAKAAAERVFLGRVSADGLDGIPAAWRGLGAVPEVLESLASTLPQETLLVLDDRSAGDGFDDPHQIPALVEVHARLGRTETATRRFKRQIACCRRRGQATKELSLILRGLRCSCLSPAWWLRASKLLAGHEATARTHELLAEAANAFPPWTRAACTVYDRLLGCDVNQGGASKLNQQFLRLATICDAIGARELATGIRVRSLPWDIRAPKNLPQCLEIVRQLSSLHPKERTLRQEQYIELAELWAQIQRAACILLGAEVPGPAEPSPHEMLRTTSVRALAAHRRLRSTGQMAIGHSVGHLAIACAELSAENEQWAALTRYFYRWAQQTPSQRARLFAATYNICFRTPPHPRKWASSVLASAVDLAREKERSGVLREAAGLYFSAGTLALICARVREAGVYLSRVAPLSTTYHAIVVNFNLSTAAAYAGDSELARRSLERFLNLSAQEGHDAENAADARLLRAIVSLSAGQHERSAELCRLSLLNAKEHAPEDRWEAWRTLIECELALGDEEGLAATLAQPPNAEIDTGNVARLLACLSASLGRARLHQLRRDQPEMQELLRWSERLPFAWGAYAAAMAALLDQQGNTVQAHFWRDRANARFRLLGWGHPVRTD